MGISEFSPWRSPCVRGILVPTRQQQHLYSTTFAPHELITHDYSINFVLKFKEFVFRYKFMILLALTSITHALTGIPDSWMSFVDSEKASQPAPTAPVLDPALGKSGTHSVYSMGDDALELIQPFHVNGMGSIIRKRDQ